MLQGISASPGLGIGRVFVINEPPIVIEDISISQSQSATELLLLEEAFQKSCEQLSELSKRVAENVGKEEAKIIEAQVMMLQDPTIKEEISAKITGTLKSAVDAASTVFVEKAALFESIDDEYLRERVQDLNDAGKRLLKNILKLPFKDLGAINQEVILVAAEITPSQMVAVNKNYVKGIITETGGLTSHTVIIAKNLGIPAVVGVKGVLSSLHDDQLIAIDGSKGIIQFIANKFQEDEIRNKIDINHRIKEELKLLYNLRAETLDGHRVELAANIGSSQEAESAFKNGAESIGLFRTEFVYMDSRHLPDEEEQFTAYRKAVEAMNGRPVIIRTLDIGGDKEVASLKLPPETNSFLGWRAIRICLDEKELFKTQLRAILRASAFGKVRIMYPMISSVDEIYLAHAILEEAKQSLRNEHCKYDEGIEVGVMIEIPAAALAADIIIKKVDFFSIGTNDLTQYTLAVDRTNEKVIRYYNSFQPAVLRLIRKVIEISHHAGKITGMCGEFAGNPLATVLLLGMGLDEFSMSSASIQKVKKIIRTVEFGFAKKVAETTFGLSTANEIENYLKQVLEEVKLSYILDI
jgi:phosphoenolpyruvate-protein phosphotransferase (PTS system enzyme I)